MLKHMFAVIGVSTAVIVAISASGCAKQEFRKEQFTAQAGAVGFRYLPAKVDILLVPDNTPSVANIVGPLQSQLSGFVSGLQGQYWDYHVGQTPVCASSGAGSGRIGSPILVNAQFNTDTLTDGTQINASGIVPSDRSTSDPGSFSLSNPQCDTGSYDYTYMNTISALQAASNDTYTNFLRADALLAVVVVTNGYDGTVSDNQGNITNSAQLQSYANQLIALKGSNKFIRFYSVAAYGYHAGTSSDYCLAPFGPSRPGNAYFQMGSYIQGIPMNFSNPVNNVCDSSALGNVLNDISQNLNVVRQAYVYSNIVLADEPVPSSISVAKNGKGLPESPTNGWQYKGLQTVYTVTGICDQSNHTNNDTTGVCPSGTITPVQLVSRTGYVIQLNGSARMMGSDTPTIDYQKH
ncbi:MAG: hypothetical protein HY075_00960 [Deltaproteobacteria bacterium]|nr:hypothetical protein [Deltaproteobacteria bacterium]